MTLQANKKLAPTLKESLMAKVLTSFEFSARTRNSSYDWDTILSGELLQLTRGEDFDQPNAEGNQKGTSVQSVIAIAQQHATARNVKIRYEIVDNDTIVMQAIPVEDQPATKTAPKTKAAPKTKTRKARK